MSKGRSNDPSSSEVDDLLRAAEDQLLLNLRLNSHSSKSSNPFTSSFSPLDSHLARRFDALKSPPNPNPNPNSSKPLTSNQPQDKIKTFAADEESSRALGDDLAARFAALKGSSSSSSGSPSVALPTDLGLDLESSDGDDDDGDGVSKKEVDKLMEWAKDAARLDPSKSDDDDDGDVHDDDGDSDDSDDSVEEGKKRKEKSKGKPKRFIFF